MIYPKIDERFSGEEVLRKYIRKSKGVEIQFFHNDGIWGNYNITPVVDELMNRIQEVKEITIHPPLDNYEIEAIMINNRNSIDNKLEEAIILSEKYNIKINMLYHLEWPIKKLEQGVIQYIEKLVSKLENTNVQMVIENLFTTTEIGKCTVLEVCKIINSSHLNVCLDICHLHCLANIFKVQSFQNFLDEYIDTELAEKYIYQIHFAATRNNDGYIDHSTHARNHNNLQELQADYSILERYNLTSKKIIPEVTEANYNLREEQIKEIEMLNMI